MRCVGKDTRISNEFVITLPDRQMGYLIRHLFVCMYFERKKKKKKNISIENTLVKKC